MNYVYLTSNKKMDVLSNCISEYIEKLWHMVKNQVMQLIIVIKTVRIYEPQGHIIFFL